MGVQTPSIFTQRVSALMKRNFLTKKDMAKRLNVDYSTFWRKLNGQRNVDMDLLKRIAEILGTSTAYLMGETENPERSHVFVQQTHHDLQQEPLRFGYWGNVADNARDVANSGDKDVIAYASQMLKQALSFLTARPDTVRATLPTKNGSSVTNMPLILGDNNESNITLT